MKRPVILLTLLLITLFGGCSKTVATTGSQHVTRDMHEAISNYVIDRYQHVYALSEQQFEVHHVYGTEEQDGITTVYLYSLYSGFNTATGTEPQSGHSFPTVVRLKKEGADYAVTSCTEPKDGADYAPSIRDMFPDAYEEQAIAGVDQTELQQQMKEKARNWLTEQSK